MPLGESRIAVRGSLDEILAKPLVETEEWEREQWEKDAVAANEAAEATIAEWEGIGGP
jgi:hypothetical protein